MKKETPVVDKTTHINNCMFTGVQWDAKAVDAVTKIADGLIQNAKGLTTLAEVLKASNVTIETMIKVEGNK